MIFFGFLVCVLAIGETLGSPSETIARTSRCFNFFSGGHTEDPNLDHNWLTHIRKAPVIVSLHYAEGEIPTPKIVLQLEDTTRSKMCPLFLKLEKPDSSPQKDPTAVLINDEVAAEMTVVLTDNKTYVVGASSKSGEKLVTVYRLVEPLDITEELKIQAKLKELGYRYSPTVFIRKDQC